MFHVDNNSGVANMPELAPAQSNTTTWFTEGDGQKGISWIGQDWLNILQAELLNILAEASIQPDKAQLNQLTLSIKAIIAANAFSRKNNLKEIADAGAEAQRLARGYLGLGTLATKTVLVPLTLMPWRRIRTLPTWRMRKPPVIIWMFTAGAKVITVTCAGTRMARISRTKEPLSITSVYGKR